MNVIGLDLSLNGTGISCGNHTNFTVIGKVKDGDARLVTIQDAIRYYAIQGDGVAGSAEMAVIEGLPFGNNDRSVALVHGVARAALARLGIPFAYVYPTTLKMFAVGRGDHVEKAEMMVAAVALGANQHIDSDQADAWWLRRMGLAALTSGRGLAGHRIRALGAVEWPDPVTSYGAISARKPVTKKCRHGVVCLRNGDHWLHPFDVVICDKPPKTTVR